MTGEAYSHWLDDSVDAQAEIMRANHAAIASARGEPVVAHFDLPGMRLEVEAFGQDLTDALTAAFSHRIAGNTQAGRGQAAGGQAEIRRLRWRIADAEGIEGLQDLPDPARREGIVGGLYFNKSRSALIERRGRYASLFDPKAMEIVTVASGTAGLDTDLVAKPLLRLLIGLLGDCGMAMCHAALVGHGGKGLLVPGRGGSGKSTIATASLLAGAQYCGDDFVALEQIDGKIIGHSLYASVMLAEAHLVNFPQLAPLARRYATSPQDKFMIRLGDHFPSQLARSLEVDGAAVPQIHRGAASRLESGRLSAIWQALTPSSVFSSPWHEPKHARQLLDIASQLEPLVYFSGSEISAIARPLLQRYA